MLNKELSNNIELKHRFKSKKNIVYSGVLKNEKKECVIKVYKKLMCRDKEVFWLENLQNVKIPLLYEKKSDYIIMQYIHGDLLIDRIEKLELNNNLQYQSLINHICHWFEDFYKACYSIKGEKYILYDVNLRNFIIGKELHAVDFEECKKGDYEQDIGRLCAFILTYRPEFTDWKISFAKDVYDMFICKIKLDRVLVKKYMLREFDDIERRRNQKLSIVDKDIIKNSW
ncbi:hypothetical protein PV797_19345 [Clostridiaceae bacterium M8S5]|nr:hypothetical protein PV797_19345 [Clostridiaceae bacterium M8S5]